MLHKLASLIGGKLQSSNINFQFLLTLYISVVDFVLCDVVFYTCVSEEQDSVPICFV